MKSNRNAVDNVPKHSGSLRRTFARMLVFTSIACSASAYAATLQVPAQYATIQSAVNAAAPAGDEILIAPGVYQQQVFITGKKLTLTGSPGTILRAWTGMYYQPEGPSYSLVEVRNNADVVIRNLTLEGKQLAASMPNANACFVGVTFFATGGRVENCAIRGFRGVNNLATPINEPIGGRGVGVIAVNLVVPESWKHVQILNNTFSDNGISIMLPGAYPDPNLRTVTYVIEGNTITGVGPTTLDTQWGIFINPGAAGVIKGNRITGHYKLPHSARLSGEWSFGIIKAFTYPMVSQPVRIEANTCIENEGHVIAVGADDAQIINNIFEGSPNGYECQGVYLTGSNIRVAINQFTNLGYGIVLLDDKTGPVPPGAGTAINPLVLANRFSCDVWTPLYSYPDVTGLAELGPEICPSTPPGNLAASPSSGLPGTTITLSGTNLSGAMAVLFNGLNAQFTPGPDPDKAIVATVPPHATTGPITVITPLVNITSLSPFTVPVLLGMSLKANEVQLSWCADACDLVLETASNLIEWQPVPTSPSVGPQEILWKGPRNGKAQFFRLRQPAKTTAP